MQTRHRRIQVEIFNRASIDFLAHARDITPPLHSEWPAVVAQRIESAVTR
jgi:hypothetical protein